MSKRVIATRGASIGTLRRRARTGASADSTTAADFARALEQGARR